MAPEGAPQGSATAQPRPFPCPCPRGPADSPPPSAGVDHRPAVCLATVKVPVQPPLPAQTKPISTLSKLLKKSASPQPHGWWVSGVDIFIFRFLAEKKPQKFLCHVFLCSFSWPFLAIPGKTISFQKTSHVSDRFFHKTKPIAIFCQLANLQCFKQSVTIPPFNCHIPSWRIWGCTPLQLGTLI